MKQMNTFKKVLGSLCIAAAVLAGCQKDNTTAPAPPPPPWEFNNIFVNGHCKVILKPGASNTVDSVRYGVIVTDTCHGTLFINGFGEVEVSVKDVDSLIANGACSISTQSTLNLDDIFVVGNGVSKVTMDVNAKNHISTLINGAGKYTFKGTTPKLKVWANGLGFFHGYDLTSKNCKVWLNGKGFNEVNVSDSLYVVINGAGSVHYKGNPAVHKTWINGIGSVVQK